MFLFGAFVAKKKWFQRPKQYVSLLKKIAIISVLIGLPLNILHGITKDDALLIIGAPFLMTFYMIIIIYLTNYPLIKRLRSEEHTSELQSRGHLVCRPRRDKKKAPAPVT